MTADIDSLLAVDLRNRLESNLEITLPATLVFDHPNLESLIDIGVVLDVHHIGVLDRERVSKGTRGDEATACDPQDHIGLKPIVRDLARQIADRNSICLPCQNLALGRCTGFGHHTSISLWRTSYRVPVAYDADGACRS